MNKYMTFFIFFMISLSVKCQSKKFYIKIDESNNNFYIKKDKCNNIKKIILKVDRQDLEYFEIIFNPLSPLFSKKQSVFFMDIDEIDTESIVDVNWVYSSNTINVMRKILFNDINVNLYFLKKINKRKFKVFDAGIIVSIE